MIIKRILYTLFCKFLLATSRLLPKKRKKKNIWRESYAICMSVAKCKEEDSLKGKLEILRANNVYCCRKCLEGELYLSVAITGENVISLRES